MASQTIPTLTGDEAYAVIDSKSYGEWDGILDLFDPVARRDAGGAY